MLSWLHKFGFPVNAAAHGAAIDGLIVLVHWLMVVLFVGWGLFFAYTLIRFRRSRQPVPDREGVRNHASRYVEIAIVAAEVVLLVGFSIPIWANHVAAFPKRNETNVFQCRVVAQQFVWNIHYPGPDGEYGRTKNELIDAALNPIGLDPQDANAKDDIWAVNDLRVPVNRPVVIRLSSLDVIHSFWLPQMRVKQDVIPGMEIPVWFKPTSESGTNVWQIACAQLCGVGHYRMAGRFNVVSEDAFKTWYEATHAELAASAGGEEDW